MSAGGVAGPHCCRSVPALKAASSLCFGRIGQRVEQAQSRAEDRRERDDNGARVGRRDGHRLAADKQRVAERAAGLLVVGRLEREHDVGRRERRAVGEGDAGPQFQRAGQAVGRARVRLRQPGLDLLRGAVDAEEARLGEADDELDAKSRPACGLNVRGSLRMVATSEPPRVGSAA